MESRNPLQKDEQPAADQVKKAAPSPAGKTADAGKVETRDLGNAPEDRTSKPKSRQKGKKDPDTGDPKVS